MAAKDKKTPVLEPSTPRKKLTPSPTKAPPIPISPWKPEHKEFWDPEVNFAWIDKHSPPKKKTTDMTGPDGREELKRRYGQSPDKKQAKKAFDAVKEDLARSFLLELDHVITKGRLAQLTETTGGLRIQWSNTLLTTAGRAHWKCKTTTTTSKQPLPSSSSSTAASTITRTTTSTQHYASIELATKVLSNESDLLNTVAHEFCHLAVFLLHGKPKLAHGAEFKTYGGRVMNAALGTPRSRGVDIQVTTRHSYEIEYRYVWRCADCGTEVRRHSKSVDTVRQRCGKCKGGVLVQVKPVPRGGGATSSATGKAKGEGDQDGKETGTGVLQKVEKKKSAYQEFTSREMKALSVSHKGISLKEKMVLVSARWSEHQKLQKSKTPGTGEDTADVRGLAGAVDVLEIADDDTSGERATGADRKKKKKAVYDIFA
jgi:predicted SprT family Zn-dependent metalloprotease